MKVQLLNPGEKTETYAVIFYQGDEALPDCWSCARITLRVPHFTAIGAVMEQRWC